MSDAVRRKPCEFDGCGVQVPVYLMFCQPHWEQLPDRVRSRINRATRRLARHPLRRDRLRSLLAAREEARQLLLEGSAA